MLCQLRCAVSVQLAIMRMLAHLQSSEHVSGFVTGYQDFADALRVYANTTAASGGDERVTELAKTMVAK